MVRHHLLTLPGAFQHFFEHHLDAMYVVDLDGRVLSANASALKMFDFTMEELSQTSLVQLLDGPGANFGNFDETFEGRTEWAILHKRGHLVYVRVTCTSLVSDEQEMGKLIVLEDITEQREQYKKLLEIQEMFAFISEKSQNIISSFSADGMFTYISPSVKPLLGYTPAEVIGKPAVAFNHPDTNEELFKLRMSLSANQDTGRFTSRLRHKDGEYRWYETTIQFIRDQTGAIRQTIGVGRDITDRKEAEDKISYLAYHDTLTDLPNRRLFHRRVSLVLERNIHQRHSLMLLDLDGFKYVNDTFGHEMGDLLLMEVAQRLTRVIGDTGVVARLGGDEFTVFQENIVDKDDCDLTMDRVKRAIAEPIVIEGKALYVTASIGVAFFPADGDSVEKLMRHADVAMYCAKQGRNPP